MHLRGLSQTLVSLQVSHSSRTRACDLKVNLHVDAFPHTSRQLHATNSAPPWEKTGRKIEGRRWVNSRAHYRPEGSLLRHALMQVVLQI